MSKQTTKAYKGLPMEGMIASWYAKTTEKDTDRYQAQAKRLAEKIGAGSHILEVAPGPGFLSIELARMGYKVTGLDISKSFVEMAQSKARAAGVQVEFKLGDAAHMPFDDESFDFIFCQAAFKNFTQPVKAIAEMYRVLRPKGVATILDLRKDASQQEIDRYVDSLDVSGLDKFFMKWTFRQVLLKNAYTRAQMAAFVAQTPFGKCRIDDDEIGFQVRMEK